MLDSATSLASAPVTARDLCEVLAKACELTAGGFVHDVLIRDTNGFEILTVEDSNAAMDALASDDDDILKDALRPLAYVADCYRKGTVVPVSDGVLAANPDEEPVIRLSDVLQAEIILSD